jgi:hypothetical protein
MSINLTSANVPIRSEKKTNRLTKTQEKDLEGSIQVVPKALHGRIC